MRETRTSGSAGGGGACPEPWEPLYGHEGGNAGHSQGKT